MSADLTAERLRELLSYDPSTGVFHWQVDRGGYARRGCAAGGVAGNGYLKIVVDHKQHYGHRLAWLHTHGVWPRETIDHIDGNKTNNCLSNLRDVCSQFNTQNRVQVTRKNKSCNLLGVTWSKAHKKWQSQIFTDGKNHYLGSFETPEEAHAAYLTAKENLHPGYLPKDADLCPHIIRTSQGSITLLATSSAHAIVLGFDIFPTAASISARPAGLTGGAL